MILHAIVIRNREELAVKFIFQHNTPGSYIQLLLKINSATFTVFAVVMKIGQYQKLIPWFTKILSYRSANSKQLEGDTE